MLLRDPQFKGAALRLCDLCSLSAIDLGAMYEPLSAITQASETRIGSQSKLKTLHIKVQDFQKQAVFIPCTFIFVIMMIKTNNYLSRCKPVL